MGYYTLGQKAPKVTYPGVRPGSVGPAAFMDGAVGPAAIAPGSITDLHVAVGAAINGAKLLDLSVDSQQLKDSAVNGPKIAPGAVTDSKVATGLDVAKLASIAGSQIGDALLATGITGSKVAGALSNATLAGSALTAGVIPSSVTINDGNWSGTALSDAHLATGLTASKVSGALSNATLAGSALTAGTVPAAVKINNGNWSGTALANSNLASGIDPSKLTGSGTVPLAGISGITTSQISASAGIVSGQISDLDAAKLTGTLAIARIGAASITQAKLEAFMRSGFLYKLSADQAIAVNVAIPFGTKVYDGQNQASGTGNINFTPVSTGVWKFDVVLRLTGGDAIPGQTARVVIYDNTDGAIVDRGHGATTTSGDRGDEIIALYGKSISVTAGHAYQVRYQIITGYTADITHVGKFNPTYGSATVKADTDDPQFVPMPVLGSYFQVTPVFQ